MGFQAKVSQIIYQLSHYVAMMQIAPVSRIPPVEAKPVIYSSYSCSLLSDCAISFVCG